MDLSGLTDEIFQIHIYPSTVHVLVFNVYKAYYLFSSYYFTI